MQGMQQAFAWTSSVLSIASYVPLLYFIWANTLKQSFATWFLWVALDVIALASMIVQQSGNTFTLKCYVVGGTMVWISLLIKKQFKWTKLETATLLLVIDCLVFWHQGGAVWATVASTLAVCISGIPQFAQSWREPDRITERLYCGYVLINVFYFLAGEWTMKDRFYPGMMVPLCLSIAWAASRYRREIVAETGQLVVT